MNVLKKIDCVAVLLRFTTWKLDSCSYKKPFSGNLIAGLRRNIEYFYSL